MIPGVPHHTIPADEQAAILATIIPATHPTVWPRILCGAPAWVARDAVMPVGRLRHHDATTGRGVGVCEIEDRRRAQDPWRCRARRFAAVHHPPMAATRWIHVAGAPAAPATPAGEQLSLLEAA